MIDKQKHQNDSRIFISNEHLFLNIEFFFNLDFFYSSPPRSFDDNFIQYILYYNLFNETILRK